MNIVFHIVALIQIACLCSQGSKAQRVPPGVNPQHYQQQQQYQQQPQYQQQQQQPQYQQQQQQQQFQQQPPVQQVPQHQQQVPVQQVPNQQVPQQQMHQQQVPQQQVPQGHQGQHQGARTGQILNPHMADEKDHIAEHMEVPIDTSKMTEQELQFHYFKMHDADNNNKLDGCELIKSLIHWHEQGSKEHSQNQVEDKIFKDDELITLIDPILNMDDNNRDGYIDYPEFVRAQQKVASSQPKQ